MKFRFVSMAVAPLFLLQNVMVSGWLEDSRCWEWLCNGKKDEDGYSGWRNSNAECFDMVNDWGFLPLNKPEKKSNNKPETKGNNQPDKKGNNKPDKKGNGKKRTLRGLQKVGTNETNNILTDLDPPSTQLTITPKPTYVPTGAPTKAPTPLPSKDPTAYPTEEPSVSPTTSIVPTSAPSSAPTIYPAFYIKMYCRKWYCWQFEWECPEFCMYREGTEVNLQACRNERSRWEFVPLDIHPLTEEPSSFPSSEPTEAPTEKPTRAPKPTRGPKPTKNPTARPSAANSTWAPTTSPTEWPSTEPTSFPTMSPTTLAPTDAPTGAPTAVNQTYYQIREVDLNGPTNKCLQLGPPPTWGKHAFTITAENCANTIDQAFSAPGLYDAENRFAIHPFNHPEHCLTNPHHPKGGEIIYAEQCRLPTHKVHMTAWYELVTEYYDKRANKNQGATYQMGDQGI